MLVITYYYFQVSLGNFEYCFLSCKFNCKIVCRDVKLHVTIFSTIHFNALSFIWLILLLGFQLKQILLQPRRPQTFESHKIWASPVTKSYFPGGNTFLNFGSQFFISQVYYWKFWPLLSMWKHKFTYKNSLNNKHCDCCYLQHVKTFHLN